MTSKTIIKREIITNNIRLTDNNGIVYHVLNNRVIGTDCFYDDQLQRWYTEYKNITPEKPMTNDNRDMTTFNNSYQNGLADEKRVIAFLETQGLDIVASNKEDNIKNDIDCWIDGIGYSIKAEHKGLQYCVPVDSSKALTRNGWKSYHELSLGEDILAYNPETKLNEFTPILALTYHKDAEVIRLQNQHFNFVTTPEHRWIGEKWVRHCKGVERKFIGWSQEECFQTSDNISLTFHIYTSALAVGGLGVDLPKKKYDFDWTKWVIDATIEQRKAFLAGVLVADGHQGEHGVWTVSQNEGEICDAMQLCGYLLGYYVTRSTGAVSPNGNKNINLRLCEKAYVTGQRLKKSYEGQADVWCPTTKFGTWVMSQNGLITITGNCNIYFELENQRTVDGIWEESGWFNTGKAEYYLILQGQELRLYSKAAIKEYINTHGWLRVRTLSWQVKKGQGGTYRFMDTKSGYLDRDKVPFISSWKIA